MIRSWLALPLLALAIGCEKPPVASPVSDGTAAGPDRVALPPVPNDPDARRPGEVLLARAPQFRPLEPDERPQLFLNVDARGLVLFPPGAAPLDAEGVPVAEATAEQVVAVLKRRAGEPPVRPDGAFRREPPPVVLRVDRDTPFAKLAPVLAAARKHGLVCTEWRGLLADGAEGALRLDLFAGEHSIPQFPDPDTRHYVVRVTADAKGQLARLTIRSEPLRDEGRIPFPLSEDLGIKPDVEAAIPEIERLEEVEKLQVKEVPDEVVGVPTPSEPVLPAAAPKTQPRPAPKVSPPAPKKNPETVLGATPAALTNELARLGLTRRDPPKGTPGDGEATPVSVRVADVELTLEIDGRLRHAHLVPLLATLDAFWVNGVVDLKLLGAKAR